MFTMFVLFPLVIIAPLEERTSADFLENLKSPFLKEFGRPQPHSTTIYYP